MHARGPIICAVLVIALLSTLLPLVIFLTWRSRTNRYADIFTCCDNDSTNGATLKPWLLATVLDWHDAFPQARAGCALCCWLCTARARHAGQHSLAFFCVSNLVACSRFFGRRLRECHGVLRSLRTYARCSVQTQTEAARHEVVYGIQGNRNPFQDFPAWANQVFMP